MRWLHWNFGKKTTSQRGLKGRWSHTRGKTKIICKDLCHEDEAVCAILMRLVSWSVLRGFCMTIMLRMHAWKQYPQVWHHYISLFDDMSWPSSALRAWHKAFGLHAHQARALPIFLQALQSLYMYIHCWENKYMPRLKNHLPSRARNHKSLCALGQDLHATGMWACLNVKPWHWLHFHLPLLTLLILL